MSDVEDRPSDHQQPPERPPEPPPPPDPSLLDTERRGGEPGRPIPPRPDTEIFDTAREGEDFRYTRRDREG
jgi:hypothetical protein